MAEAYEGTTIFPTEQVHVFCDGCCSNPAINYCAECESNICDVCSFSHMRLKGTRDHELTTIDLIIDDPNLCRSAEQTKISMQCANHPSLAVAYCNSCEISICQDCETKHLEAIKPSGDACRDVIQQLFECESKLQEMRKIYMHNIDVRREANTVVAKVGDELLEQLENVIAHIMDYNNTIQSYWIGNLNIIDEQLCKIDAKIPEISNLRNDSNTDIQLQELVECARILKESLVVKHPKKEQLLKFLLSTSKANPIKCVKSYIADIFASDENFGTVTSDSVEKEIHISDAEGSMGYKFCKRIQPMNKVVIYGVCTPYTRYVDIPRFSLATPETLDIYVIEMIAISNGMYVAIAESGKKLYLLNSEFQIIESIHTRLEFSLLCAYHAQQFMVCEIEQNADSKIILKFIYIVDDTLVTKKTVDLNLTNRPIGIAWDRSTEKAILVSSNRLSIVDVTNHTSHTKHYSISAITNVACCVFVTGKGTVLIGDAFGKIFEFSPLKSRLSLLVDAKRLIHDIFWFHGKLIVTTQRQILLYCSDNKNTNTGEIDQLD